MAVRPWCLAVSHALQSSNLTRQSSKLDALQSSKLDAIEWGVVNPRHRRLVIPVALGALILIVVVAALL